MRAFLFVIAAAALVGAALCIPVRLEFSGTAETGCGCFCLTVRWLLYRTRIWFDLCFMDPPAMTLLIRHGSDLTVRPLFDGDSGKKMYPPEALRRALSVKTLLLQWHIGIRDDAAGTVLLGGVLEQAGRMAAAAFLSDAAAHLQTEICPRFDRNMLRLHVRGIAIAFPAQIIAVRLKGQSRTSRGR